MKKVSTIAFLAFLSLSPYAWADGINTLAAGGITTENTQNLTLNSEILNISARQVLVDYEFQNTSNSVLKKEMSFNLPKYPANIEVANAYFGEPESLSITVNQKPVEYTSKVSAFLGKKEVTSDLIKAGLSKEQIAYFPSYSPFEVEVPPLTDKQVEILKAKKLLMNETPDGGFAPAWEVQVKYVWTQTFKPQEKIAMQQSYQPFVGLDEGVKPDTKEFCATQDFSVSWDKLAVNQNGYSYLPSAHVSYNRSMVAKDFTLNIEKSPEEIISTCATTKELASGILQLRQKNSKENVSIYFGNTEDMEPVMPKAPKLK